MGYYILWGTLLGYPTELPSWSTYDSLRVLEPLAHAPPNRAASRARRLTDRTEGQRWHRPSQEFHEFFAGSCSLRTCHCESVTFYDVF